MLFSLVLLGQFERVTASWASSSAGTEGAPAMLAHYMTRDETSEGMATLLAPQRVNDEHLCGSRVQLGVNIWHILRDCRYA